MDSIVVTAGQLGFLVLFTLLAAACALVRIAAPWTGGPAPAATHWLIARTVVCFDFWLEVNSVRGRRRRELRDELRANLYEASAATGAAAAVQALGSKRELAREYARADRAPNGPCPSRWQRGFTWAAATLVAIAVLSLVTTLTWVDASLAGDSAVVAGRPVASPWLFHEFRREDTHGGFSLSTQVSGWVLLLPVTAFGAAALSARRGRRGIMVR